jgi:hypothetical protein
VPGPLLSSHAATPPNWVGPAYRTRKESMDDAALIVTTSPVGTDRAK